MTFKEIKITQRRNVALVCPHDSHTEYVVERALNEGIAHFILFKTKTISSHLQMVIDEHADNVTVVSCADDVEASNLAVAAIKRGDADVLMKGTISSDILLHAVLNKQCGLLKSGAVMTHLTFVEIPALGRMLLFSDAAVLPQPTLEQFDAIVRECANACRSIGIEQPHIALTNCAEKVNPKFEHTLSYVEIIRRAEAGDYGNVVVGGPMDVKTALENEGAAIKGITSPVVGKADVLVFPNIQAGNTFYKTLTLFAGAEVAGLIVGTTAPVVVASRADSEVSKYYSLLMACRLKSEK